MKITELEKCHQTAFLLTLPYIFILTIGITILQRFSFYFVYNPFIFLYRNIDFKFLFLSISGIIHVYMKKEKKLKSMSELKYVVLSFISSVVFISILLCKNAKHTNNEIINRIAICIFYCVLISQQTYTEIKNGYPNICYTYINGICRYIYKKRSKILLTTYKQILALYKQVIYWFLVYRTIRFFMWTFFNFNMQNNISFLYIKINSQMLAIISLYYIFLRILDYVYNYNASISKDIEYKETEENYEMLYFYFFQISKGIRNDGKQKLSKNCLINIEKFDKCITKKLVEKIGQIEITLESCRRGFDGKLPSPNKKIYVNRTRIGFLEEMKSNFRDNNALEKLIFQYNALIKQLKNLHVIKNVYYKNAINSRLFFSRRDFLHFVKKVKEIEDDFYVYISCDELEKMLH